MNAPIAPVTWRGKFGDYRILCPYCGSEHVHGLGNKPGTRTRLAPGCGTVRTPEQRLTGYIINY